MDAKGGTLQSGLLSATSNAVLVDAYGHGEGIDAACQTIRERGEKVLCVGEFAPSYIQYATWLFVLVALSTMFLPLLLFVPCVMYGIKARYASFKIVLSDKTVTYMSGQYAMCCMCWSESERLVPLEKITDCTWKQGCLQRHFGVDQLDIRTAAGSMAGPDGSPGGADISLTGLLGAKQFRTALLKAKDQRDHFLATGVVVSDDAGGAPSAHSAHGVVSAQPGTAPTNSVFSSPEGMAALSSIDETLQSIKDLLFSKAEAVTVDKGDNRV